MIIVNDPEPIIMSDYEGAWDSFVSECCEIGHGMFTPYLVMESAFGQFIHVKYHHEDSGYHPMYIAHYIMHKLMSEHKIQKSVSANLERILVLGVNLKSVLYEDATTSDVATVNNGPLP